MPEPRTIFGEVTATRSPSPGRVAVVGGGIAGLTAAHFLARAGARVTLYEASDQLGGLGTFFAWRDVSLERFYHCMLPSDRHLLAVLRDLGLEELTYWKETGFGFMRSGRLYGLNTPAELLRFDVLPMGDRLRVGLTGLWGSLRSPNGLDDVTCEEWLTKLSGRRAFESFWKPMLQAKFGDRYHEVPALWFWTRFNREKGGSKERKGYIRGGYRRIVDSLVSSLEQRGCIVRASSPVQVLDLDDKGRPLVGVQGEPAETFDRAVLTSPLYFLRRMVAGGKLAPIVERADPGIDMQGVVNAVLMLRCKLSRFYWVAAIDAGIPFQGIVESTNLLDTQDTGGVHLVYLLNYLHRSEPEYSRDDADVLREYLAGLHKLFPHLRDDDVVGRYVFRTPFVEPLYTTGYARRKPPHALLPGRVYLSTSIQVYPNVTSWNGATEISRAVVDRLLEEAGE
jgi:protoporphyrinogen oxidase